MKLPSSGSRRRSPTVYLTAGFLTGVMIARNAQAMDSPSQLAVFLIVGLVAVLFWRSGKRSNAEACAVAAATAIATAKAEAVANATATANQTVQILLQQHEGRVQEQIINHTRQSIENVGRGTYDEQIEMQGEYVYPFIPEQSEMAP